jgi:carbon-monoxide dehydrogenase medium subunit
MPPHVAFYQPGTAEEVIAVLTEHGDGAKVLAGGTALTILLRQGLIRPSALVSLARVHGITSIQRANGTLEFGALVTHRQVEQSSVVRANIPSLGRTFGVVGNVRIRNSATVGGVLAEADYASDPPAAFLALDAVVDVHGPSGTRAIPIAQFFRGFYETALSADELLTGVRVPIPAEGTHAVYQRFVSRSNEDRPCVGVFAATRMQDDTCHDLRVAVGAASETPQRFTDLEALARGQRLDDAMIQRIADGYAERIDSLSDTRGSAWYRREMIRVWVRRGIELARAGRQS